MEVDLAAFIALILAGAGLLGVLILVFAIPQFCPVINNPNPSVGFEWWFLFIYFLFIGLAWFLARNVDDMYTFNESGTKLFGRTPTSKGYIATKWICVFFFPVLPVASYEVLAEEDYSMRSRYAMNRLDKLFWPQIAQTWFKGFFTLVGIIIVFTVISNIHCFVTFQE